METASLSTEYGPRDRVRAILYQMAQFDNTVQYTWFLEIARAFFNFQGDRITLADCNWLCDTAEKVIARADYEKWVLDRSNIEKVFLTNAFDDPLEGFDKRRYVPRLEADELLFHLHEPDVRSRLAEATGVDVTDSASMGQAVGKVLEHFTRNGARACTVTLPPDFVPSSRMSAREFDGALAALLGPASGTAELALVSRSVFLRLVEGCRDFKLPLALMVGAARDVYRQGVAGGRDLFDHRTSLMQYAELFNAFPEVTFCVSVLSAVQNQELASFSWLFPNVMTSGHWWYSNIPAYIQLDCRARLQAVPKTKQLGYFSDMVHLEFGLPKYNMYRRILAQILADDFVRSRVYSETQALGLSRLLLRDNALRIFNL